MNISSDTKISSSTNTEAQYDSQKKSVSDENENESFESFLKTNNLNLSGADQSLLYNLLATYEMPYSQASTLCLAQNIQDIKSSFSYDTMTIGKDDAMFFNEMLNSSEVQFNPANAQQFITALDEAGNVSKTQEVSKTLLNLIEGAHKTQQPVRLDFDNNISVILRVDQSGKLSAEFLPSDSAAEQYLRNNISYLRQSLDSQNIDYNEVYYRTYKNNKRNQNNDRQGDKNE